MSSFRLVDQAHEITESLIQGCPYHSLETHGQLLALFRDLDHKLSTELLQQCRMMSELERSLTEEAVIRVGLDSLPLYASKDKRPRSEAAALVIVLMPLSMEITRNSYCPELSMEALRDVSLSSHCVQSVKSFLNDSIDARAPIWQDRNLVRGRYFLEVYDGFTGQSDDETRWIGEHSFALSAHVNALEECRMIDRAYCESLLNTTKPLLTGLL